jgi:hypothetical protein
MLRKFTGAFFYGNKPVSFSILYIYTRRVKLLTYAYIRIERSRSFLCLHTLSDDRNLIFRFQN